MTQQWDEFGVFELKSPAPKYDTSAPIGSLTGLIPDDGDLSHGFSELNITALFKDSALPTRRAAPGGQGSRRKGRMRAR